VCTKLKPPKDLVAAPSAAGGCYTHQLHDLRPEPLAQPAASLCVRCRVKDYRGIVVPVVVVLFCCRVGVLRGCYLGVMGLNPLRGQSGVFEQCCRA